MIESPTAPRTMTPRQKTIAMVTLMATMMLAILDMNIVSAATVPIVRELDPIHGVDRVAWLISAFALASTAVLPLYGKLCDIFGSKQVFLFAVGFFTIGSILCGFASDMGQLIAFRAVQGVGGGGLMSVTMVVMAQMQDTSSGRGKAASVGGLMGGVGVAAGPIIGGLFADAGNWRWIFWVNVPLGIAIVVTAALVLHIDHTTQRRRIDFLGAALAAAFATGLMLVAEWGGTEYAWTSPTILGIALASLTALGLFIWRQATAAEPILPLPLFSIRIIRLGYAIQTLIGVSMMGVIVYVMVYLQVARGIESTGAALFMIPFAVGLAAAGLAVGKLTERGVALRSFLVAGTALCTAALLLLSLSTTDTSLWIIRGEMLLFGAGAGQLLGILVMAVIDAAPPHQIGVVTTGIRFFQTLGGAIGAAVLGTVLTRMYTTDMPGETVSGIASMTGPTRTRAIESFVSAADTVFLIGALVTAGALLLALRLPRPQPTNAPDPANAA